MKIPVNRHYYSLVTENVDSVYVPNKNSGDGRGSLRPGGLRGRGWTTLQTKQGGSLRPGLWGDRRPYISLVKNYSQSHQRYAYNDEVDRFVREIVEGVNGEG